jgi:hypothetical protein
VGDVVRVAALDARRGGLGGDGWRSGAKSDADADHRRRRGRRRGCAQSGADAILFVTPPNAFRSRRGAARTGGSVRSPAPDIRTDLDTTPTSVTEVRLVSLDRRMRAYGARW